MKSSKKDLWSVRVRHSWRTLSFSPVSVTDPESTDWGTTSVPTLLSAGMLVLVTLGSFWTLAVSTLVIVLSEFSTLIGSANAVNPSASGSSKWSSELISVAFSFFTTTVVANSPHCMLPTNKQSTAIHQSAVSKRSFTCKIYTPQCTTILELNHLLRKHNFACSSQY